MRRRILLSSAGGRGDRGGLGLPLGAAKLVEDLTAGLSTRASRSPPCSTSRSPISSRSTSTQRLAVPGEPLIVRTQSHYYVYGADPGDDQLVESVPMVQSGR